jgi:hypothetical protein
MRKTLWIALSLALLAAGAALAVPTASSPALQPAVSSPAPAPSGLPPGALPMTRVCPVGDFCVWAKCECDNQCIRQHVPGTLTSCFPSTSTYTCTCQLN